MIELALNFNHPDEYSSEDFLLDTILRELSNAPSKDLGKAPYLYLIDNDWVDDN